MAEPADGGGGESQPEELSSDAWLGGRLTLVQPRRGHRAGTDAALLAAAADFPRRPVRRRRRRRRRGRTRDPQPLRARERRSRRNRRRSRGPRRGTMPNRNGLAGRARVLPLDICDARARREAGLDAGSRRRGRHQPAVLRRRRGSRFARPGAGAGACLCRRSGRRAARRLDSRLPRDPQARRTLRHDPSPGRPGGDPRRVREQARRGGAPAGSSARRRAPPTGCSSRG